MRFMQCTSQAAADIVYAEWGRIHYPSVQACWDDRSNWRGQWAQIIWRYNQPDGITLYQDMVRAGNDIIVGIRNREELQACREAGLVDFALWVKRSGAGEGTASCTVSESDCDISITNDGTIDELCAKLDRLCRAKWGRG